MQKSIDYRRNIRERDENIKELSNSLAEEKNESTGKDPKGDSMQELIDQVSESQKDLMWRRPTVLGLPLASCWAFRRPARCEGRS